MMIVRILIAAFVSLVGGACFLASMNRLMSGLLLGFGVFISCFFGVLFAVPASEDILGFPLHGKGGSIPFFLVAIILAIIVGWLFLRKKKEYEWQQLSKNHFYDLAAGFAASLLAIFLPALLWFPSEEKRSAAELSSLETSVIIGTVIYLLLVAAALFLFARASKGGTEKAPDFMRRIVLTLMAIFHLDKLPALIAYILIYSPETGVVFGDGAALALSSYLLVGGFLLWINQGELSHLTEE